MKKKCLYAAAMLLLVLAFAFGASAAKVEIKDFNSKSTFKPVSYSTHKSVAAVTLYGNADYLCMKAVKDTKEKQVFRVEVFSDSKRKKMILEYENDYKKGTKYDDILFDLTELKSKTYYATSYVIKKKNGVYNSYEKDKATVTKFKIVVKRDGTEMKKMKTVMYGYENSVAGPIVYWYSVPGATKYYVYKKKDGKFKKIKTVKAAGGDMSYYIDTSLKDKNATAVYKVRALNGTGKTPLSEDELKVAAVKTPKVTVKPYSKGGIRVTWSKVSSDATYFVYMAQGNSDWQYMAQTKSRSYVYDYQMKNGTAYYFTVVAVNSKGTSGSENDKGLVYFSNPVIKSLKEVSGNFVISWDKIKGADSYNVYKKVKGDAEWTKIGNTKSLTFTDFDEINRNTLYSYCVRSVRGSEECVYRAPYKSKALIDVPGLNPVKINSEGYPVISWTPVENASYNVYRKAENDSNWSYIAKAKEASFTDYNNTSVELVNGEKYFYTVSACIGDEDSGRNENSEAFIWYRPIEKARPSPSYEGIRIDWEGIKNIEGYNVYRKSADGGYALIGNTAENYFNDTTAAKDVKYFYKIVGVSENKEKTATAAELPAKLSSQYVTALEASETNARTCCVKVKNYDSGKKYAVYTKADGEWIYVNGQASQNDLLIFSKNRKSYVNEYAVVNICDDGTVTSICDENIFMLEYICPPEFTVRGNNNDYTATVTWESVYGAEKYNIYLGDEKIATLDSSKTSYKSSKLKAEKYEYHYFTVGAVRGKTECIADAQWVQLTKRPAVKAKINGKSIRISWEDTAWYEYTLYRKTSADGEWKAIAKVNNDYYDDINVVNGKTYYYMVSTADGIKSEKEVKTTFIKPVTISDVTLGKKSVELKWKKSSAAEYYMVYKKKDGKWKKVYTTKNNKTVKYTDKDVKAGKKYYYRIYAVKNGVKSEYTGRAVSFITPPAKLKATAVSGGVKLTFNKVEGAKKYVIYRKSGDGKYKKLKTIKSSACSYTDKSIKKGVKYTYYVKAYNNLDYSKASSKVSFKN